MLLFELFDYQEEDEKENLQEHAKIAWARVGDKIVKKYRCTTGTRQGRIVSHPSQCGKPLDLKKRLKFRQTKLAKGSRMAKKANRTKTRSPASKRLQRMNKSL